MPLGNSAKNLPKTSLSSADLEVIDVSLNRSGIDVDNRAKSDRTNENEVKGTALVEVKEKKIDPIEAELREVEQEDSK